MNLTEAQVNKRYIIEDFSLPVKVKRRLQTLGLTRKTKILLINKKALTLIIKVRGTKFAIGHSFASGIIVYGGEDV